MNTSALQKFLTDLFLFLKAFHIIFFWKFLQECFTYFIANLFSSSEIKSIQSLYKNSSESFNEFSENFSRKLSRSNTTLSTINVCAAQVCQKFQIIVENNLGCNTVMSFYRFVCPELRLEKFWRELSLTFPED